jgi:hypothetical protein
MVSDGGGRVERPDEDMLEDLDPHDLDDGSSPDGAPIYLICDNLAANKTPVIRACAGRHRPALQPERSRTLGVRDI